MIIMDTMNIIIWQITGRILPLQSLLARYRRRLGLAKDGEKYVAMGSVVGDGMYYTIVDVTVRPEYQGKKIGATIVNKLVALIEKNIPEGGRTSIQLIAAPGKEEFYIKQGFKILPNEESGAALRKVIYT